MLQQFEDWLARLLGYYAVEHAILHSTAGLLSSVEVNALWEQTSIQIAICLKELLFESELTFSQIKQAEKDTYAIFCLRMKQVLIKFCLTVQQKLSLHISPLLDIMEQHKEKFAASLKYDLQKRVFTCLKSETFHPMELHSSQHAATMRTYHLLPPATSNNTSTDDSDRYMPFSNTVIELIEMVAFDFLDPLFSYAQYLGPMDDRIRQDLIDILTFANDCIDKSLQTTNAQYLYNYAQITVNAEYLAKSCKFFEREYYHKGQNPKTIPPSKPSTDAKNQQQQQLGDDLTFLRVCHALFQQTRCRSEDLVLKALLKKIEDNINVGSTSAIWSPNIPSQQVADQGVPAFEFLVTLTQFLETSYSRLRYMQKREYFFFQSYQTIANKLLHIMSGGNDAIEVNIVGLRCLKKALDMLDSLAGKVAVPKAKFCLQDMLAMIDFICRQDAIYKYDLLPELNEERIRDALSKFDQLQQTTVQQYGSASVQEQKRLLPLVLKKLRQSYIAKKGREDSQVTISKIGTTMINATLAVAAFDLLDDSHEMHPNQLSKQAAKNNAAAKKAAAVAKQQQQQQQPAATTTTPATPPKKKKFLFF